MRIPIKESFIAVLIGACVLVSNPRAQCAIKFTSLFSFNGTNGAIPEATLVEGKDGYLYSTTIGGGTNGVPYGSDGTIFRVSTNGEFSTMAFMDRTYASSPQPGLVQASDGNFYGTSAFGGPGDWGAAFRITTNGTFSIVASFQWPALEYANGLVEGIDGLLYGTGYYGGTNGGYGSIVSIGTNGSVALLASFGGTNGAHPQAPLVCDREGNFYGTTVNGGSEGDWGTVFQFTPDGRLVTLVSFGGTNGANPMCKLHLEPDGSLYGITSAGGLGFTQTPGYGNGTIFKITPDRKLVTLHYFTGYPDDGAQSSFSGLFRGSDGKFYGTSQTGGANGSGTIFSMAPDGTVTVIYSFTPPAGSAATNLDGWYPSAGVVQASDGNFYGVTMQGGVYGLGSIFRFNILPDPPVLQSVSASGGNLAFSWAAAKGARYQVQYTRDLASTNWTDLGSPITASSATGTASDPIGSDPQRFYRIVLLP